MNTCIRPGQVWLDTNGNRIQAHGFSVFYSEKDSCYYWYGENKEYTRDRTSVWHWGVRCYASKDLYNWEDKGLIIPPHTDDLDSPLHPTYHMDRPHFEIVAATLNDTYTSVTGEYSEHYQGLLPPVSREAPACFQRNGKKNVTKSQWFYRFVKLSAKNPGFKKYVKVDLEPKEAQPLPGEKRWNEDNTWCSDYVWLPVEWIGGKPVLRWHDEWRVEDFQ